MRTLQVSKFYPPVMGGVESVTWELAEGLNRCHVRTDVLCAHTSAKGCHDRAAAGYDIWRAGTWGKVLSTSMTPSMPWCLARLARPVDLVHLHMPDPMAALSLWYARPLCKVVVHWHSDVIRQQRAVRLYEPLQRWLLQRADAIIATSATNAEASIPLRPWRNKVRILPIGISDNRPSACSVKATELKRRLRGRSLVFALGRMTYYKGFDVLINAAAMLPNDCAVMIGGTGELHEECRKLVNRKGLAGKVHLLGHIEPEDLASHFEACDVFCLPSTVRAEAYGVAILEAMVMGKPVVATRLAGSGVPWVNQHGVTGLNVAPGDPADLAGALTALLKDSCRRSAMGEAARARYVEQFGSQRMIEGVMQIYRELA
jgi:rhamnosyl/mannosyltransferase